MQAQGINASWITGIGDHNLNMVYFTGLHHISYIDLIKLCGKPGNLFQNPMEREKASKTGLSTSDVEISSYPN